MKPNNFLKLLDPKKKCMQKDPSGAQFGAEKIAREKKHLEHDLEHKKLHAKKPSGAQFEARKVAREKGPSGTRFEAQKAARENIPLEHDLEEKKLHKKNNLKHGVEHKKLHAKRTDPEHDLTIRFEAQKVEKTWRDFFCKMKLCSVQF